MWLVITIRDYLLVVAMYCIGVLCGVLGYCVVCFVFVYCFVPCCYFCVYSVVVLYVCLLCRLCSGFVYHGWPIVVCVLYLLFN